MAFRMFARGTGGYHHTRNYSDEGDAFELADALGRLDALSAGVGGVAAGAGSVAANEIGNRIPNSDGGLQAALSAMGTLSAVDALNTTFTLMLSHARSVTIYVVARSEGYFVDDVDNFRSTYSRSDAWPVGDFLRDLTPTLENADLNRFVVLGAISRVIEEWDGAQAPRGERLLNMAITNT